ncbi:biotin transporter BioY [Candidatus Contubernalis alkaliaceticus]|uniref:biotin transporter BioY n=1 Tax=Candidatus Contubernalis alkaliaceticus TaxID=338645 RepID=UPI001F4BF310|nr:biotin transporter BioY [Candidatus Contubernalis alkalaceticus]UNC91029.1 biotin transporter BioY [Candidatus Contubernalis alkalaceticus]
MMLTTKDITFTAVFTAAACMVGLALKIVPVALIPFSLLPLVAMLAGGFLGSRLGALSMTIYMVLGLVGLPVFSVAPFGGLSYIFQPSFGFVPGYIACAFLAGKILENKREPNLYHCSAAMLAGLSALYIVGLIYLYLILNLYVGTATNFAEILMIGFLPFILFDLIKAALAVSLTQTIIKRINILPVQKHR